MAMKKRDKNRERREIVNALAMLIQIGLAMMTCMAMSFGIGYYLDRLFGTKYWVMIFLLIGIMAAIRSLFVLIGKIQPSGGSPKEGECAGGRAKGELDAGSKEDAH